MAALSLRLGSLSRGAVSCTGIFAKQKALRLMSPTTISRNAGYYWNHDWKPGPYPRTPEERARAAKRYGLLPEDYEPYPDDGNAPGDYPNLPAYSANHRDLFEFYEHNQLTRHHGEPMHLQAQFYRIGYLDPNDPYRWQWRKPLWKHYLTTLCYILGVFVAIYIGDQYKYFPPVMAKQFPYDKKGQKHYTFEPAD